MEGHSVISADILARYAADAAREIEGVTGLVEGTRPRHRGVKVTVTDGVVAVQLHLAVAAGANVPDVGQAVQQRVAEYLGRMADIEPRSVDIVVDEIESSSPGT